MKSESKELKEVCPRCGSLGSYYIKKIRNREYIYFWHWVPESKKVKLCYLGPKDEYMHVERIHTIAYGEGYGLTNLKENDLITVADQAIEAFERTMHRLKEEALKEYLKKLLELKLHLEKVIKSVEESLNIPSTTGSEETDFEKQSALKALKQNCGESEMRISPRALAKLAKINERKAERVLQEVSRDYEDGVFVVECSSL